jgi:hypothetical protein
MNDSNSHQPLKIIKDKNFSFLSYNIELTQSSSLPNTDYSAIQTTLNQSLENLNSWLRQLQQVYAIIRKRTYTVSEVEQLAAIFSCQLVRVITRYNLVKNGQVLFNGNLTQIVDYCFNNLIQF